MRSWQKGQATTFADLALPFNKARLGRLRDHHHLRRENGGRWDHVVPPNIDEWGCGGAVFPTIIHLQPSPRRHFVDNTQYGNCLDFELGENRFELCLSLIATETLPSNDLTKCVRFYK